MRFFIDEQLPPGLVRWFEQHGHAAEHVLLVGLLSSSDGANARRALADGAVMVTKDKDYLAWRTRLPGLRVLWLRLPNVSNRLLYSRLEEVWPDVLAALGEGESLVTIWPADRT